MADSSHSQERSDVRLMHPSDILDFVGRELQGEQWSEEGLFRTLADLYNSGGGTFDPLSLLSQRARLERDEGAGEWVTQRQVVTCPCSHIFLAVSSRNRAPGLEGQFLRLAQRHDGSAPDVAAMLRQDFHLPGDLLGHSPAATANTNAVASSAAASTSTRCRCCSSCPTAAATATATAATAAALPWLRR